MSWTTKDSEDLYGINDWGAGYFSINSKGNMEVRGSKNEKGLDLAQLIEDLCDRGLRPPILVRVGNILENRVKLLTDCFANAIKEYEYNGLYCGVYPIKVNQQKNLVEELVEFGKKKNLGLECGSKPELLVALALMDSKDAHIVCNGFKDDEYIETALLSQKLGRSTFIVMDRFAELDIIIKAAKKLNIKPQIGLRAKLTAKGAGRWNESSGTKSKFGLTPTEIIRTLEILKQEKMLDCLELLHFHIGSQVPSIQNIKTSIKEAGRFFTELYELGAKPSFIDVGGGLGVDYDGSGHSENSTNYTEQEYANDVVSIISDVCNSSKIPHPNIISESGRFLVAHSSMLIFDVLGTMDVKRSKPYFDVSKDDHQVVHDLKEIHDSLSPERVNEHYNDLIEKWNDVYNLFSYGALGLKQRAKAEDLYWAAATKLSKMAKKDEDSEDIYWALQKELSSIYFCNFSVFQSLPDSWAVKQLFPMMPIQRLNEKPQERVTLVDLTCDSDGKIENFIDTDTGSTQSFLEVHDVNMKEPYYIGAFMAGAYQEILGDLHNLFGDTDMAYVTIGKSGKYVVNHVVEGDSVNEVLGYLGYYKNELQEKLRKDMEQSIESGSLNYKEARLLKRHYEEGLSGYTYLE